MWFEISRTVPPVVNSLIDKLIHSIELVWKTMIVS